MNTGLIIGIISLSLVSIVVVVVIRMNKKTSPTPTSTVGPLVGPAAGRGGGPTVGPSNEPTVGPSNTSAPTQAPSNTYVPTQVPPNNYTKLYEYLSPSSPSGISGKEVSGYKVDKPSGTPYAYSLLNTSSYNITKVGFNFNTTPVYQDTGVWLYKLDKNKVASGGDSWATIYGNKLYIQNILIEPGESFVIDIRNIVDPANFEITFVEVLLPG